MLLERLSRKSREHCRAQKQYEELLRTPSHRLLTIFIEQALNAGGTAIAFGFHRDDDAARQIAAPPPPPSEEELRDMREIFSRWENAPKLPPGQKHAWIRGPHGSHYLPVWYLKDGILHGLHKVPFTIYATLLNEYLSRLVSINGTPDHPQPCRYIELSPTATQRRFVEVDLEWTLEDLFMIHLRTIETPPHDANISQGAY